VGEIAVSFPFKRVMNQVKRWQSLGHGGNIQQS
jgi:hypothetical protein